MTEWLIIITVAVGTYLERASLMLLLGRGAVPQRVERTLRYVGPSVIAALAMPPLLAPQGTFDPLNLHLAAGIAAAVAAWYTRSLLWTLVAGLATFGALTLLL